jgi:hypothetical protein
MTQAIVKSNGAKGIGFACTAAEINADKLTILLDYCCM